MKEVITGKELKKVMSNAVDLICNATASSLGPTGNNVIINADLSPYITNDGVTIARNISSENKKIDSVLDIIKEASLKTNDKVGDGTTTTLVLLQSIFKEGLKKIDEGINPIKLKNELNDSLITSLKILDNLKRTPTKRELVSVASIAVGNKKDGSFISDVFFKMKSKYSILLDESKNSNTYYEVKKGYSIEIDDISSLYFNNKDELMIEDAYILIIKGYLNNLESISEIINEAIERNKNIIIFADDFSDDVKNNVLSFYLQSKNIFVFKTPDYGSRKEEILEDLKNLCDCTIKDINFDYICFNDLGMSRKVIINNKEVIIINTNNNSKKRIRKIKSQLLLCTDDYEKEFLLSRLAKFEKGIATIYVGGNTKTEIKEKTMRYDDALCALETAKSGILLGEGVSYLKIANELDNLNNGNDVMKKALQTPFNKIIENIGFDSKIVIKKVKEAKYNEVYNFETNEMENIDNTCIIDSADVLKEALTNATSVASMLLTINYLVINENIDTGKAF